MCEIKKYLLYGVHCMHTDSDWKQYAHITSFYVHTRKENMFSVLIFKIFSYVVVAVVAVQLCMKSKVIVLPLRTLSNQYKIIVRFQASGDHLPVAPPAPPQVAPQPQYQPQQQYQAPSAGRGYNDYDDGSYDPRYNDPSFSQNTNNNNAGYRAPAPAPIQHQAPVAPAPVPQYNQYNNQPQQHHQQQQQHFQQQQQTESPSRFQPPGKLQLNRTPDGFSYSFNKV